MLGHNQVWLSGNVGGNVKQGKTRDASLACSFSLASEANGRGTTWVRVNAYGDIALDCIDSLDKGAYCSVIGELMNREGRHGEITEVRAISVIIHEA